MASRNSTPPAEAASAAAPTAPAPAPAPGPEAPKAAPAKVAVAPAVAPPIVRSNKPLILARWSEAQFKQARHAISPEPGTRYEEILDPAFFANIAPKVNSGDIIEVRPGDGSYYAELYVWNKGANWLQVSELKRIERPTAGLMPAANTAFSIEFVEGPHKHRVLRNSDRGVIAHGFDSPEAANLWLAQNLGRIAA